RRQAGPRTAGKPEDPPMKNRARLFALLGMVLVGLLGGGRKDPNQADALGLAPGGSRVTWQGNQATIEWNEDLADPKAAPGNVPFSLLSGPYIGWLTGTSATVGWEVVGEKSLTASPYASLPADYDVKNIRFR